MDHRHECICQLCAGVSSKYPDETLPGYLRDLRHKADRETALTAKIYGSDPRTRAIAIERLAKLEIAESGAPPAYIPRTSHDGS